MFREGLRPPDPFRERDPLDAQTQDGVSLRVMSGMSPVLVVCLPAWRAARALLEELAARRDEIERKGTRIALVHMASQEEAHRELEPLDLHFLARVADPDREIYAALGLKEVKRFWAGSRQLPGAFLLVDGEIRKEFRPRALGERPDFSALA